MGIDRQETATDAAGPPAAFRPLFGELLRAVRERRGLSQGDLAALINHSVSLVSLLESGRRRPTRRVLDALRQGLADAGSEPLSQQEDADLAQAAGLPLDELDQAIKQVLDLIVSQVSAEEPDRSVILDDLTTTVLAWRDVLIGKRFQLRGEMDKARDHFVALRERPEFSPTLVAQINASLADVSEKRGELAQAEAYIQAAQRTVQPLPPHWARPLRAEIDAIQGMMASRQGRYVEADIWMRRGQDQYVALLKQDGANALVAHVGLAKSAIRKAFLALLRGDPRIALEYCEHADSYMKQVTPSPTDRRRLRIIAQRAWALSQLKRFDEARDLHAQARDLYAQVGDAYGVAKNWLYLGDDYRLEIEAHVASFEEATDTPPATRRANLAAALAAVADLIDQAMRCYEAAIHGLEAVKESIMLGRGLRSLGEMLRYKELLQPDQHRFNAQVYLNRALTLESEIGQGRRIPTILESLARLEWDHGAIASAAEYYQAALAALASPRVSSNDAAGQKLQARCQNALAALQARLAAELPDATAPTMAPAGPALPGDEDLARQWHDVCQRLIQEVSASLAAGDILPMTTSDVDARWLATVATLETEEGPRIIAQNALSASLSPTMPAGCPPEAATTHASRWYALLDHVMLANELNQESGGPPAFRDLCYRASVEARAEDPALGAHCQQEIAGAIELLQRAPRGYALSASVYELPLSFAIKGERVMIKLPAQLVASVRSMTGERPSTGGVLCYALESAPELAQTLTAIFDELVQLAESSTKRRRADTLTWLLTLTEASQTQQVGATHVQPM